MVKKSINKHFKQPWVKTDLSWHIAKPQKQTVILSRLLRNRLLSSVNSNKIATTKLKTDCSVDSNNSETDSSLDDSKKLFENEHFLLYSVDNNVIKVK